MKTKNYYRVRASVRAIFWFSLPIVGMFLVHWAFMLISFLAVTFK
jgi:hypothetical protein